MNQGDYILLPLVSEKIWVRQVVSHEKGALQRKVGEFYIVKSMTNIVPKGTEFTF